MATTWSNREDIPPKRRDGWLIVVSVMLASLSYFFQ